MNSELSVNHSFKQKWGPRKIVVVYGSINCKGTFFQDNQGSSVCNVFFIFISSHIIAYKRHISKGSDSVKLTVFTALSRTSQVK